MSRYKTYHDRIDRKNDDLYDRLIQRKLEWFRMEENGELGNDPLEKEADDSAQKIVHGDGIDSENLSTTISQPQGKAEEHSVAMENSIAPQLESSKGGGRQLDDSIKGEMEEKMNTDLSDVRVHTDSDANKMSEDINAKAFAHGQDIYFKDGNFDTDSNEGKKLLAHELTHTQQQGGGVNRRVQRAVKIEFQTGNYIWKVKKNKYNVTGSLLPRKWGREGVTDEDGSSPIYLAKGEHGDEAIPPAEKGDFIPMPKPDVVTGQARTNTMVKATGVKDESLSAQYIVIVLVKDLARYIINENIPKEEDLTVLTTFNRRPSILMKENPPGSLPAHMVNMGTYEFKYYAAETFFTEHPKVVSFEWDQERQMGKNSEEYINSIETLPTYFIDNKDYADVHRDEQGVFRRGHVRLMQAKETEYSVKKPAHFQKEYEFVAKVNLDEILDQKLKNGQLKERIDKRKDNSDLGEGQYHFNTFNIKYFNEDGIELPMHIDEYGYVRKGARELMKVGKETIDYGAEKAQFFQEITLKGINSEQEIIGKTANQLSAENLNFSITEGPLEENTGPNIIEGTYNFIYATETKWLNVHRNPQGVFEEGYVELLRRASKAKEGKEQTAIELQSEEGGFVEFETPKWLQVWSELKLRVEDAVKMTKTISNSPKLVESNPDDKIILDLMGEAAVYKKGDSEQKKIKSGSGLIGVSGRKVAEGKNRKGTFVRWPKNWSTEDLALQSNEELLVEIVDPGWGAKIQFSEGIELAQFEQLLLQHEQNKDYADKYAKDNEKKGFTTPDYSGTSIEGRNRIWKDVQEYIKSDESNLDEPKLNNVSEEELQDLKGFILLITNYLLRGQGSYLKEAASKFGFLLMARTSFYSMYHSILTPQEQKIFRHLVKNNTFITRLGDLLMDVADISYTKEWKDWYYKTNGVPWVTPVTKYSYVIKTGYGTHEHQKGPTIGRWLISIYEGGGSDLTNTNRKTDLMSRPVGGSASMGRFDVETDYGKTDTNLVKFEVRSSIQGNSDIKANQWVNWAEREFKFASEDRLRKDITDDPSTPDINESTSTGLIYDPENT